MPARRRRPTMFERKLGMSDQEMMQEQEVRHIHTMIDQWHQMQMDEQIEKDLRDKKVNDRIMSFADKSCRLTECRDKRGNLVGSVKGFSKKGN